MVNRYMKRYSTLLIICCSVTKSLQSHGLHHARLPFPSLLPWVCPNSCSLTWWCHQVMHHWSFSSVQLLSRVQLFAPHELQHARPPCPSPTPKVYSNSHPLNQWCHPAISSSVVPFSSCLQSLPASGSFPMSQLFAWSGQIIGVSASASVLPVNIQDLSPLGWTSWISLQSKGCSRVFFNATV